jgi:hypothetical protein
MATIATDAFSGERGSQLTLRVLVTLAALAELVESAAHVPALFMDHAQIPGPGLGGAATLTAIALKPLLSITAIGCALTNWQRAATCALAGVGICTWLNDLPALLSHGLDVSLGFASLQLLTDAGLVLPVAIAAIWLALRTNRLGLAAALACLPTAIKLSVLIVFVFVVATGINPF